MIPSIQRNTLILKHLSVLNNNLLIVVGKRSPQDTINKISKPKNLWVIATRSWFYKRLQCEVVRANVYAKI